MVEGNSVNTDLVTNPRVKPLQIFSLICKRDIETSLPSLLSVTRHLKDPHTLTLLSDGSLSPEDERRFATQLPAARLISRSELNALLNPVLTNYKRCKRFRDRWPWALKLIDLQIVADDNYGFIDSDILMLHDIHGFDASATPYDLVHMKSYANIYCVSLFERRKLAKRWRCINRLNSGFMFIRRSKLDLDVIEEALAALADKAEMPLAEQTVWAMAAGHMRRVGFFDPKQIAFPLTLPSRPLAVHYIGATRGLLKNAVSKDLASGGAGEKLRIYPSRTCNSVSGAIDVIEHAWILRRWKRHAANWLPG